MDFLRQNKMGVGGAGILLLAVIAYFMFFSGGSKTSATLSTNDSSPVPAELLVALQNLNTIRLDDSIFTSPVFVSLADFGVSIPAQNVGRRNPFLPLGGSTATKSGVQLPSGQ